MLRRWLTGGLVGGLLYGWLLVTPAGAGDLLAWLRGDCRSSTVEHLGGAMAPGTAARAPEARPILALFRPQYAPVPPVPNFNWGYFGAPRRPLHFCHTGCHGDVSSWCYRRKY